MAKRDFMGDGRVARRNTAQGVLEKYVHITTDGCWEWTGVVGSNGYGRVSVSCKLMLAHRFIYSQLVGTIPPRHHLDHLCRNRKCVNPTHLEPVTAKINNARSLSPSALNAVKTHCKLGHELSGGNLYIPPKRPDRRYCKKCQNDRSLAYFYMTRVGG